MLTVKELHLFPQQQNTVVGQLSLQGPSNAKILNYVFTVKEKSSDIQYINHFKLVLKIFDDLYLDESRKIPFSRMLRVALNLSKRFLTKEYYFGFTFHLRFSIPHFAV